MKFVNIAPVRMVEHENESQEAFMRRVMVSVRRYAGFVAAVFAVAFAVMPGISSAQKNGKPPEVHMCSLLTEADVAPIVGVKQMSQETKGGATCMWGDPGNDPTKLRLLVQRPSFGQNSVDPLQGVGAGSRDRMESTFKVNRKQAFDDKSWHAKDEPQIGKNAFSAVTDDGAEIVILKKSCVLNIRYMTGKRGTTENVEAIRKVAEKVSAAF
jgi:hypothetical protein